MTFQASDAPSDCFNGFGEPDACAGLDLLGVEVGLQEPVLDVPNDPKLPVVFVVTFADSPATEEEFGLYLYVDLDQNTATGLDMSSGPIALPGIDRIVGATLPDGESWTQLVAKGGYDAEIIKDGTLVSARIDGDRVVLLVGRGLLDDHALAAGGQSPSDDSLMDVGHGLRPRAAGGAPDAFTLYIGTARSIDALDYFNGGQDIQVALAMTVPEEALYPPCPGGS